MTPDLDILCCYCHRLMVHPTTLNCGHNLCRVCLATWFDVARQRTCPGCRQRWYGIPKVNINLRNLLQGMYAAQMKEREEQEMHGNRRYFKVLEKFDKQMKRVRLGRSRKTSTRPTMTGEEFLMFGFGMILTFLCVFFVWNERLIEQTMLVKKPVVEWNPGIVALWLHVEGCSPKCILHALNMRLDGIMLLAMDDVDVRNIFHPVDVTQERTLKRALEDLRQRGAKRPSSLLEFQYLYPRLCLVILYGMAYCPRLLMTYLFLAHFDDLFTAAVHFSTSPPNSSFLWFPFSPPTSLQYKIFLSKMLFLPYWVVFDVSMEFYHEEPAAMRLLIFLTCLCQTGSELCSVHALLAGGFRLSLWDIVRTKVKMLTAIAITVMLCPALPVIVNMICICAVVKHALLRILFHCPLFRFTLWALDHMLDDVPLEIF